MKQFCHNAGNADVTTATTGQIQNVAAAMVDEVGSHKLHAGAVAPLTTPATTIPNVFV